jgi:hypothetical protein
MASPTGQHEMAYLSLNALIAEEKQALLLIQLKELTVENQFFRERYEAGKLNTDG